MSRTLVLRLSGAICFSIVSWIACSRSEVKRPSNRLDKITDDLYEIEGDGGNVAFYITDQGVILVDDKFDFDFEDILTKIKSVTPQPVKYVLNTHHHHDHTGSNGKFLPMAQIISTVMARNNIIRGNKKGKLQLVPAQVVFTQEYEVFLGGKQVQARYYGRGHTNGDAVIYFPALRILHTGDLMAVSNPFVDYSYGGSIVDWTKTLDEVLKLDFDTVIPGHGPIAKKADLLAFRNELEKLRNRTSGLVGESKTKEDIAKVLMAEFGLAADSALIRGSLDGLLNELRR